MQMRARAPLYLQVEALILVIIFITVVSLLVRRRRPIRGDLGPLLQGNRARRRRRRYFGESGQDINVGNLEQD